MSLETLLGFLPKNADLFQQALTHSSCQGPGRNNERLEFLGDAVVGLCLAQWLSQQDPQAQEGILSRRRSQLCCEKALAFYAQNLGAVPLLQVQQENLRHKPSVQADAFEALCGSLFIEYGYQQTQQWLIERCSSWFEALLSETNIKDAKSRLQELTQKKQWGLPQYELIKTIGPANEMTFFVRAQVAGHEAMGRSHTKKQAEQEAAFGLLAIIGEHS